MGMTSCAGSARAEDFGNFEKVSELSWVLPRVMTVDFRLLTKALRRVRTRLGWGRWKSQNIKNLYLSPYVEEPLNSKVIKSFVPEQRSRKCLSCFEIPMFYVIYIWTFDVHFPYSCMAMVHPSPRPVAIPRLKIPVSSKLYYYTHSWRYKS